MSRTQLAIYDAGVPDVASPTRTLYARMRHDCARCQCPSQLPSAVFSRTLSHHIISSQNHGDHDARGSTSTGTVAGSFAGPRRDRGNSCPRKSSGDAPVARYARRSLNTSPNNTESPRILVNSITYSPPVSLNNSARQVQCNPSGCSTQQFLAKSDATTDPSCARKLSTTVSVADASCTTREVAEAQPSGNERGQAIVSQFERNCYGGNTIALLPHNKIRRAMYTRPSALPRLDSHTQHSPNRCMHSSWLVMRLQEPDVAVATRKHESCRIPSSKIAERRICGNRHRLISRFEN